MDDDIQLIRVGTVESPLADRASAPLQGYEGSPESWLVFEPEFEQALDGIREGDDLIVLTWLDRAHRDVLRVHPRSDPANPEQGVFNTRSPDRPNPIGVHRVNVLAIEPRYHLSVAPHEQPPLVASSTLLPSDGVVELEGRAQCIDDYAIQWFHAALLSVVVLQNTRREANH